MSTGSNDGKLKIEDFPNNQVNDDALPQIEVHTIISENKPGEQWIESIAENEFLIREKWIWSKENTAPKRMGFKLYNVKNKILRHGAEDYVVSSVILSTILYLVVCHIAKSKNSCYNLYYKKAGCKAEKMMQTDF